MRVLLEPAVGEATVLLDLTEVSVIDSEGLWALRDLIRCVHEQGGRVAICRPWRVAREVFGLVGAEGLVFLALSLPGAIAWFNQHPHTQFRLSSMRAGGLPAGTSMAQMIMVPHVPMRAQQA